MQVTTKLQQQPFYGPLIHDNPGETVPETIRHINLHYHPHYYNESKLHTNI